MKNLNSIVLCIIAIISVLTIGIGTRSWMNLEAGGLDWDQALYASFLAIGGSDIYHNHQDFGVQLTRWFGAGTGLAVVLGLLALIGSDRLRRFRVSRLKGHRVLVGVNEFALSYMLARQKVGETLVLVDNEAALVDKSFGLSRKGVVRAPIDFTDDEAVSEALGSAPKEVVFGDPVASLNIERAQSIFLKRPNITTRIRSEKQNITADLDLWSDVFADVPILSETEFVARALVTDLEPMNIARSRGQTRPHIAVIGIGDMALGIIEELALRCHAHDMGQLKISTFDRSSGSAQRKLDMERSGLGHAIEMPETATLDGTECGCLSSGKDPLIQADTPGVPFTAIIVCTGDDEVNVDIALRLRRLQDEDGLCMAPILMRSRATSSIAPDPITDISSGLYRFGGPQVRKTDIEYEKMQHRLGQAMHDIWNTEVDTKGSSWDSLDLAQRRTNTRAALSAVELFQTLGLVPPDGAGAAALRVHPDVIDCVLNLKAVMPDLAATEHKRWVAERWAEGWVQTEANPPMRKDRDDRRKIHWLMMDFDEMQSKAPAEVKKDSNNVQAVFDEARRQYSAARHAPTWKKRVRIGVMGPLALATDTELHPMLSSIRHWLQSEGITGRTHRLEIVTPNAPGFDRIAASALMVDWTKSQPGSVVDLLLLEAEKRRYLDLNASGRVDGIEASAQSAQLAKLVTGRTRRMTLRGGPIAAEAFLSEVAHAADAMSRLCDLMVYSARAGGGDMTRQNAAARDLAGKAKIWFEVP
ncbi:MAG: hypothetical protein AB8B94_06515 [Hyphomicrobiales bacterium]